jgi:IS66 C-terminal element
MDEDILPDMGRMKNALFAGHDQGAENWACKLHGVDPQAYIADVLTKLVNLWPALRLDDLMPGPGRRSAPQHAKPRDPPATRTQKVKPSASVDQKTAYDPPSSLCAGGWVLES